MVSRVVGIFIFVGVFVATLSRKIYVFDFLVEKGAAPNFLNFSKKSVQQMSVQRFETQPPWNMAVRKRSTRKLFFESLIKG